MLTLSHTMYFYFSALLMLENSSTKKKFFLTVLFSQELKQFIHYERKYICIHTLLHAMTETMKGIAVYIGYMDIRIQTHAHSQTCVLCSTTNKIVFLNHVSYFFFFISCMLFAVLSTQNSHRTSSFRTEIFKGKRLFFQTFIAENILQKFLI